MPSGIFKYHTSQFLSSLCKGIPLFSDVPQAIQLMSIHTQQYDNGYVQTRYRVIDKSTL